MKPIRYRRTRASVISTSHSSQILSRANQLYFPQRHFQFFTGPNIFSQNKPYTSGCCVLKLIVSGRNTSPKISPLGKVRSAQLFIRWGEAILILK